MKDYEKSGLYLRISASQIKWQVACESLDLLPIMQSDIMVSTKDGTAILIIDAKYYSKSLQQKQFDNTFQNTKKKLYSSHLYQIFTYVKNAQVNSNSQISGMLLYAKTDEELTPNADYIMSGNHIAVKTLDLAQDFKEIKSQLNSIIFEWYGSLHFDIK